MSDGLLPLALLCLRVRRGAALAVDGAALAPRGDGADDGPYRPWTAPLVLLSTGDTAAAARLAAAAPDPPPNHLRELLWALVAETALRLGSVDLARRAHDGLSGSAAEDAGAGSGVVSLGPVSGWLARLGVLCGRAS